MRLRSSATWASIQVWISSLTSRGSRPAGSTGGPIRNVTVPGRLRKPRRGQ